jgi:hypothetical protein
MGNTCVWLWLTLVKHDASTVPFSACKFATDSSLDTSSPCLSCCRFYQNDRTREETRKAGEPVLGALNSRRLKTWLRPESHPASHAARCNAV